MVASIDEALQTVDKPCIIIVTHPSETREYCLMDYRGNGDGQLHLGIVYTLVSDEMPMDLRKWTRTQYSNPPKDREVCVTFPMKPEDLEIAYTELGRAIAEKYSLHYVSDEYRASKTGPKTSTEEHFHVKARGKFKGTRTFTPVGEDYYFKKYQWLRYKVHEKAEELEKLSLPEKIEGLHHISYLEDELTKIRNVIVDCNIGLPTSTTASHFRKFGGWDDELFSENMLTLLRAIDKFDPYRGYKFSTYATRSFHSTGSRFMKQTHRHHSRNPLSYDPALDAPESEPVNHMDEDELLQKLREARAGNLANLTDREQAALMHRFDEALTLEKARVKMHVSKERVRQLQNKGLGKLRRTLENMVIGQHHHDPNA
jgi:RNA polymerase sigma factor (sigma-70 family)